MSGGLRYLGGEPMGGEEKVQKMRRVTQEEANEWMSVARTYGFATEDGFALGRFILEEMGVEEVCLQFVTPLAAGSYTEQLESKTPPIQFDRTPAGEIIIPGRWWAHMFELVSEAADVPEDLRRKSAVLSRRIHVGDVLLPPTTETIRISVPDEEGEMVPTEALPPGTRARIRIQPSSEEDEL